MISRVSGSAFVTEQKYGSGLGVFVSRWVVAAGVVTTERGYGEAC